MASTQADSLLSDLEARMAAQHLRGQWQVDPHRPQDVRKGANGQVQIDPVPSGVPHIWKWQDMLPLLRSACAAMTESYTARRALTFKNPNLQRGTTQTLVAGLQIVPPGEVAWAHRHTMTALRFTVQGGTKVFTVVDGRPLVMEPYDLILTPGWSWHDHHNESGEDAIWMDGLHVPFTLALNQAFYEEPGARAIPKWTWQRQINRSQRAPAILFVMTDTPILRAFGFYREETEDRVSVAPALPAFKLSAAE